MSSSDATSLLSDTAFFCFPTTNTDVYLTDDTGYSVAATMIRDHSLPKANFRQVLCRGLLSFSGPLVPFHVLTKSEE